MRKFFALSNLIEDTIGEPIVLTQALQNDRDRNRALRKFQTNVNSLSIDQSYMHYSHSI